MLNINKYFAKLIVLPFSNYAEKTKTYMNTFGVGGQIAHICFWIEMKRVRALSHHRVSIHANVETNKKKINYASDKSSSE